MLEVGAKLPGGTYRLGADRHARLVGALGTAPPAGEAHPLAAWVIAMGGNGISIGELFERAGVPMEDGPMLGACDLELHGPIEIETEYTVTGEVAGLVEKTGRKLGRFDVLTLRLDVAGPDGTPVATCSPAIILPRR
jgi:hypothetical protein